jgi:hypothetical protein
MSTTPAKAGALAALLLTALDSVPASSRDASEGQATRDALAAEIARLKAYLASNAASGEI